MAREISAEELAAIKERYTQAEEWLKHSTWVQRSARYGPYVAQAVLKSFNDIATLLEALDG